MANPGLTTAAPYPSLGVRSVAQGVAVEVSALVDTGFDGHLVVPESLIATLPPPIYVRRVRTASGEVVPVLRSTREPSNWSTSPALGMR